MKSILTLPFLAAAVAAQGLPQPKPVTGPMPAPLHKTAPLAVVKDAEQPVTATGMPTKAPAKPTVSDIADAAPSPFAASDLLMFDEPSPGAHWVHGRDYKAGFTAAGFEFHAAPPVPSLPSGRLQLALRSARVGDTALPLATAAPARTGTRILWQRGALTERVDVAPDRIEHSFEIATLPARGAIELELLVTTDLQGEDRGDGIRFHGACDIDYSEAVAIDRNGDRVHAETRLDGDRITIQVPAAFVATAALPIVIDPIAQTTTVVTNTAALAHPDLAWDESQQCWAVVYDRAFSSTDTDVYLQRLDADLLPIGGLVTIDFTGSVFELPKVANNRLNQEFLVVAQVNTAHQGYQHIAGRVCSNVGVTQPTLEIERNTVANHGAGSCSHPDVAGDPSLVSPTYFTVVWEEEFTAADHDIAMKQVRGDGTLRTAAPNWVAATTSNESFPTISKSAGGGSYTFQVLAIAWQHTFSAIDEDIYGALYDWNGVLVPVGGSQWFPINSSTANDLRPAVSTSTLGSGTRRFVVAYERPAAGNGQVMASCFTSTGSLIGATQVQTYLGWPGSEPTADCDGSRFTIGQRYVYSGSGTDTDLQTTLLLWNGNSAQVQDTDYPASSFAPEYQPNIASVYSGSGSGGMRYAVGFANHDANGYHIRVTNYHGYGVGNVVTRPTGCGGLGLALNGVAALGETVTFQVASNYALTGVLLGFPTSVPIPSCPSCTMGVNGSAVLANPTPLAVPANPGLLGLVVSAQGFTFGGGPCLSTISVSDTIDVTIR